MLSSSREPTEEDLKARAAWDAISALPQKTPVERHNEAIAICKQYNVELRDEDGIIYRPDGTFGRDFN